MTEPYILDNGHKRLILNKLDSRSSLMIEAFGCGQTIMLSPGEMLALAKALCDHARRAR